MSDFDTFFVGDGSHALMEKMKVNSKNIPKLICLDGSKVDPDNSKEDFFIEDDIKEFSDDAIKMQSDEYEVVFAENKYEVYDKFNFLLIKSMSMGNVVISEDELVVDDADRRIIEYLKLHVDDYYAVRSVAKLMAYENMGVYEVVFKATDDCPICKAYDGLIMRTSSIIETLNSGNYISHPYCDCDFFPVIRRESYSGPLFDYLDVDSIQVGDKNILNFPVEFDNEEFKNELSCLPFRNITFINMVDSLSSDKKIAVAHYDEKEDVFFVHNSYVNNNGPSHFVSEFLDSVEAPSELDSDTIMGLKRYFINGHKVVRYNNQYWDAKTGKLVK